MHLNADVLAAGDDHDHSRRHPHDGVRDDDRGHIRKNCHDGVHDDDRGHIRKNCHACAHGDGRDHMHRLLYVGVLNAHIHRLGYCDDYEKDRDFYLFVP